MSDDVVKRDDLAIISMGVILHAGNARDLIFKAINQASEGNFELAEQLMKEANTEFVEAHQSQTATLQKEAEGIEIPYSVLFGHAQDTLMTIKTEHNMAKEMIKLYKKLGEKL